MNSIVSKLQELREQNPDIAAILDSYEAVENIYTRSLYAMGATDQVTGASAPTQVTIAVEPMPSINLARK